jgi:hypothetical protein
MTPLRGLVAGSIFPDCITVTAPSKYNPRQTVEHRVAHWHDDVHVAEIRVNLALTHRSTFHGPSARDDALLWCQTVAPHDTGALRAESERLVAASREARQQLAAAYGYAAADEPPRVAAPVAPVEVVPVAWERSRVREQERLGVGIWKLFRLAGI